MPHTHFNERDKKKQHEKHEGKYFYWIGRNTSG